MRDKEHATNNFAKDINVPSKEQIIIDGVDVSECERHCSDNYNTPNMCYSDITRGYRHCNPKENQCDFYITSIEEQLARKTQECEELKDTLSKLTRGVVLPLPEPEVIDLTDCYRKALDEIEAETKINCEEICGRKFEDCNDLLCTSKSILDIINKAKGEE